MSDEQVGQIEPLLQLFEQVDDLRLYRHVERRYRLVAHDQLRIDGQGAGHPDALALAAAELVRIAVRHLHQTLASGRAVTTKLPILTVVQRIPSGPNGIQRIPAESPANDAPSLASCNWRIPTGGSPAQ